MLNFRSKHFQISRVIEEEGYLSSLFGLKGVPSATYLHSANHDFDDYCLCGSQTEPRTLSLASLVNS